MRCGAGPGAAAAGTDGAAGAGAFPQPTFFLTNSRSASSCRRSQPRQARRSFCIRDVAMTGMISSVAMSQDRLEASLDIDRRPTLEIVRIIQEQDRLVADAVAAEAERIALAIDQIA